jgi:hypothetical protein
MGKVMKETQDRIKELTERGLERNLKQMKEIEKKLRTKRDEKNKELSAISLEHLRRTREEMQRMIDAARLKLSAMESAEAGNMFGDNTMLGFPGGPVKTNLPGGATVIPVVGVLPTGVEVGKENRKPNPGSVMLGVMGNINIGSALGAENWSSEGLFGGARSFMLNSYLVGSSSVMNTIERNGKVEFQNTINWQLQFPLKKQPGP